MNINIITSNKILGQIDNSIESQIKHLLDFQGYSIFFNDYKPKLKLSDQVELTPAYRAEMDSWLVDMFGMTSSTPDFMYEVDHSTRVVFMTHATYQAKIKHQYE